MAKLTHYSNRSMRSFNRREETAKTGRAHLSQCNATGPGGAPMLDITIEDAGRTYTLSLDGEEMADLMRMMLRGSGYGMDALRQRVATVIVKP